MQNKCVCPKCGQIYDSTRDSCPLCGTPAPEPVPEVAPRRRITDQERRERRAAQARQEREARRSTHSSEEPEPRRSTQSFEEPEPRRRASSGSNSAREHELYLQELERREREQLDATRARIPRGCLIFSAILLIVALLISGSFLLWKAGVLNLGLYNSLAPKAEPQTAESHPVTDCESIALVPSSLTFEAVGATQQLTATAEPASSVGTFVFSTGNAAVATVNANGLVTAVGEGQTVITVTMGKASAVCPVSCSFPVQETTTEVPTTAGVLTSGDEPELNNPDMTFFGAGEFFVLKVENAADGVKITWSSDNEAVATVDDNGKVVAVADGTTTVTAVIGDMTAESIIRCNFKEE